MAWSHVGLSQPECNGQRNEKIHLVLCDHKEPASHAQQERDIKCETETGCDLGPFAATLAPGQCLLQQQNTEKQ